MSFSLAAQLEAARRSRFVGRDSERTLFQSALRADELPFLVLYIYGPGGVGKTTLLREFAHVARQSQTMVVQLDGRNLDPTPDSFLNALRQTLSQEPSADPFQFLAAITERTAFLIDTYELLGPLDGWLRDSFLPQLPGHVMIVLAGRRPPALTWRADPGWRSIVRLLPLRNFDPTESRNYLEKHHVPAEQHQTVLDFTHGHPLALSLVTAAFAQHPTTRFQPEEAPDVVRTLVEQFVQSVPSPAHRTALEACALVHMMTESLLAAMLETDKAHAVRPLFDWLRDLSFIDAERRGLFPHDLAREALVADLRWRNPDLYADLHRRARTYYMAHFERSLGQEQRQVLLDYIFLHRDNPVVRPYFDWQGGDIYTDTMRPTDEAAVLQMVAAHEGETAVRLAASWIKQQPDGVSIFRDSTGQAKGLLLMVDLDQTTADERAEDPAILAAWDYLQDQAPLRPGERATHFRFWMAEDTYQAVSLVQSRIFLNIVQHYLTTPGLAFTFLPCIDIDFWAEVFAHVDLQRIEAADYEIGGNSFGIYGHDWRVVPPLTWLALMAEREIATTSYVRTAPATEPLLVLSEAEFVTAVRDALRHFADTMSLKTNALLRSRLVIEHSSPQSDTAERVAALQTLLKETADSLQQTSRQRKFLRALHHTYFQPAPTQEQAAELLDLPFSTYRRHLRAGIERVAALLWQQELGGMD